jgi:hypothetical protein
MAEPSTHQASIPTGGTVVIQYDDVTEVRSETCMAQSTKDRLSLWTKKPGETEYQEVYGLKYHHEQTDPTQPMTDYSVNTAAGEGFPLVKMHTIAQQAVAMVRPIIDQVPDVARQCWDLKAACQARVSAAAFRIEYLRVLNALPSGSDGDPPPVLMVMNGRLPDPLMSLIQACTTDVRILLGRDASEITTRQYRCLYWASVNCGLDGHTTMPVMTRLIGKALFDKGPDDLYAHLQG